MGHLKKCHLIIFSSKQLSPDKISFIREIPATADVVTDLETIAPIAETALADAIIVIEDKEKDSGIVKNLRQNTSVDQVPILSFNSIEEATKIVPLFFKSKSSAGPL